MEISAISTYPLVLPGILAEPTHPPGSNNGYHRPPPSAPATSHKTTGASSEHRIKYFALQSLQKILSEYPDISTLSSEEQEELLSRIRNSDLIRPGIFIDVSA